jgi:hypothetical protein
MVSSRRELAGGGVDDPDLEVVDELEELRSGVFGPDADVVDAAVEAQGKLAVEVDSVRQHAVVPVAAAVGARAGLRAGLVGRGRGGSVRQGAVRPMVVVGLDEGLDECVQVLERGRLGGLSGEPLLQGLLEALDLPAGGGWGGSSSGRC